MFLSITNLAIIGQVFLVILCLCGFGLFVFSKKNKQQGDALKNTADNAAKLIDTLKKNEVKLASQKKEFEKLANGNNELLAKHNQLRKAHKKLELEREARHAEIEKLQSSYRELLETHETLKVQQNGNQTGDVVSGSADEMSDEECRTCYALAEKLVYESASSAQAYVNLMLEQAINEEWDSLPKTIAEFDDQWFDNDEAKQLNIMKKLPNNEQLKIQSQKDKLKEKIEKIRDKFEITAGSVESMKRINQLLKEVEEKDSELKETSEKFTALESEHKQLEAEYMRIFENASTG